MPERGLAPRFGLWIGIVAATVWMIDLLLLGGGTPHPLDDIWEYGLVAKSLLAGHGFRTPMIHPPLWPFADSTLTVPVMVHGPLLPLIGAPLLALFGPASLDHAAWLAALFATLTAAFAARAAARAWGTGAGFAAASLVTLSPTLTRAVHHDIAPVAGACALALAIDLIARPHPRAMAAGLALGIGTLARPELLLVALAGALWIGRRGLLRFGAGFAIAIVPWWVHGLLHGVPGFNLSMYLLIAYTHSHPGLAPLWDFAIPPARWPDALLATLPELPAKWAYAAPRAIRNALMAPGPGLGIAAAVGLGAAALLPRARRHKLALVGLALLPIVVTTLTEPSERYVAVFLPLWAIGAVYGVRVLLGERRHLAPVALIVWLLPFTLSSFAFEGRHSGALRDWLATERAALASRAGAGSGPPMYSDTPDFVAWTLERSVIATTLEAYREFPAAGGPARGGAMDEWFHADVHAAPVPTPGGSLVEIDPGRP
jgi:hypothetical protein